MKYIEPLVEPTPPFAISDGIGAICVHDANGVILFDELTPGEAQQKVGELNMRYGCVAPNNSAKS